MISGIMSEKLVNFENLITLITTKLPTTQQSIQYNMSRITTQVLQNQLGYYQLTFWQREKN